MKLDDREHRLAYEKAAASLLAAQIEYKTLASYPAAGEIDSATVRQRLKEAKEKFEEAVQAYREAKISFDEFNRYRQDYETDSGYYGAQRSDMIANKSGLTQAREAFERAKMNLEWTEIKAPFPGYVADCELEPGIEVQLGKVLMKVVDVSRLLVDVEVLESEIGKMRVGAKAEVSVNAHLDKNFTGTVAAINPIVDARSKTVKVTVQLRDARPTATEQPTSHGSTMDQRLLLRPGMFATVRLESEILPNRLLVPKDALLVRYQRTLVFIARGGLAKWQYVTIGEDNEKVIEIRSGVLAGDTVIIGGHYTLSHDAKVLKAN